MALTNYQRGANKERRIVNFWRAKKCVALRSAGSHSIIDVVVISPHERVVRLIQSKLGKLSNKERERIKIEGEKLNGEYEVKFELWD